jgi:hypothetical protein
LQLQLQGAARAHHSHLAGGFRAVAHGVLRGRGALRRRPAQGCAIAGRVRSMDSILVVNAGSSKVRERKYSRKICQSQKFILRYNGGFGTCEIGKLIDWEGFSLFPRERQRGLSRGFAVRYPFRAWPSTAETPLPLWLVKITGQPAERREAEEDWG